MARGRRQIRRLQKLSTRDKSKRQHVLDLTSPNPLYDTVVGEPVIGEYADYTSFSDLAAQDDADDELIDILQQQKYNGGDL